MIKYISSSKIDRKKYDTVVEDAVNSRIYANSWYLDAVADSWGVLVEDDYQAVMPLPKRKKYGLNYIYLLPWVQQLGIFSKERIKEDLIKEFISNIPKRFVLVDYNFSSENYFKSKFLTKRINYVLPLKTGFEEIIKKFNSNRKRILKKDFSEYFIKKDGDKEDFLLLYNQINKNFTPPEDALEKLQKLLDSGRPEIYVWNVYQQNKPLAGLMFLKDKKRITYLLPLATDEAKKMNIPSLIVYELIKEYQNTNYLLDFEGSMIEGVAGFYKSFGAEKEEYYRLKRRINLV